MKLNFVLGNILYQTICYSLIFIPKLLVKSKSIGILTIISYYRKLILRYIGQKTLFSFFEI